MFKQSNTKYKFRCKFHRCTKKIQKKKNHAHILDLVINLVSAQLKRESVNLVKSLVTIQNVIEANSEKQSKIITEQIITLLDLQEIRKPHLTTILQLTVIS